MNPADEMTADQERCHQLMADLDDRVHCYLQECLEAGMSDKDMVGSALIALCDAMATVIIGAMVGHGADDGWQEPIFRGLEDIVARKLAMVAAASPTAESLRTRH